MKKDNFVKDSLRDEYFRLREKELQMIQDKATGKVRSDLSEVVVSCLLCASKRRRMVFVKDGFEFYKCLDCNFVYVSPQIEEDKLYKFCESSSSYDLWVDVLLSEASQKFDTAKYNKGLDIIEKYVSPDALLDVGCSIGLFMSLAEKRGWQTVGLELNKRAFDYATSTMNLDVRRQLLNEVDFKDETFQAITLWGVIEHFKKPADEMRYVHQLLAHRGILLVFCPNVESLVCRVLQQQAATFDGQVHCGYFSPSTLTKFLHAHGFSVLHVESFVPDLNAIFNYLDCKPPYAEHTDEKSQSLRGLLSGGTIEQIKQFIVTNHLGYKMMVVAQKE